jgi:hypothetical protein
LAAPDRIARCCGRCWMRSNLCMNRNDRHGQERAMTAAVPVPLVPGRPICYGV